VCGTAEKKRTMPFDAVLTKLKSGLAKTREAVVGRLQAVVRSRGTVDETVLDELEEVLIGADVGVAMAGVIVENVRRRVREERYETADQLTRLVRDEIARTLCAEPSGGTSSVVPPDRRPHVVMVVGVNGSGKTTTVGKLAARYREGGRSVLVGAADTFRAAANEQLEVWAGRAGVDMIRQAPGADPAAVAYDTVSAAMARGADVVLIDTAGRLHTRVNLMEELSKVRRVIGKRLEGAPHEVLLVLDATTGQNGIQQARRFQEAVGVTGLVVTKLDGTARGGIVFAISNELKIPVRFVGVGEGLDDLQPFDADVFVRALFDDAVRSDSPEVR
jgi:fused signal recognition particle receptor